MTPCDALDDYLAHDLTGDDLARFTAHLPECTDCRRAVGEHERFAALLGEAVAARGPVPAGLTERVGRRLRAARRRRFAAAVGALAAAVAVVWLVGRTVPRPVKQSPEVAQAQPAPEVSPSAQVRVTFPPTANVIVVPEPSDSPNVTFLWVYPGLRTP
jgi:anti-sigma factor RsiW